MKSRPPRTEFLPFFRPPIGEEEIAGVVDTLRSNWITTGPKTREFESRFAKYVGADGALSANSWTAAAHTALMGLEVGPGDEVITTPMTFCATANIIEHVGARPVLVDVEPDTLNIDPLKVAAAITPRTKVLLPVHYAGHPADLDPLEVLAAKHGLHILEDAAHALPARYKGRIIGSGPNLVAFSFYATKNLCTGEGGMLTGDLAFLENLRLLTLHGMSNNAWNRYDRSGKAFYEVVRPGFKYNMTDIQSAMGLHQLEKLKQFDQRRREIVGRYNAAFGEHPGFEIPVERGEVRHAWHLYVLRLNLGALNVDRDAVVQGLKERQIGTSVHFIPIHLHAYYRDKYGYHPNQFPVAYSNYQRMISLPLHPSLSDGDVDDVIAALLAVVKEGRAPRVPGAGIRGDGDSSRVAMPAPIEVIKDGSTFFEAAKHGKPFRIYLSPPQANGKEGAAIARALRSQWIAPIGPSLKEFEERIASRVGVEHACGVTSGTAAIHLGLRGLGVGPGDTVVCPTFCFVAVANPVRYLGAEPVFIDSDKTTWNMDPDLLEDYLVTKAKSGKLPKAVVVADIYGQCADFDRVLKVCEAHGVPVLEDAAEALGARYKGREAGSFGKVAALSFNGNKIITTSGGGMVLSDSKSLIRKMHHWATQARENGLCYEHRELGYNYRLSNLLAAVGLAQMESLEEYLAAKRRIFDRYVEGLADLPGLEWMPEPEGWESSRWLSCALIDPDASGTPALTICEKLNAEGIEARPLWKALHQQSLFKESKVIGGTIAEMLSSRGISLPSGTNLTQSQQDEVIDRVRGACEAVDG